MKGISKRAVGLLVFVTCLAALPGAAAAKTGSPPVDLSSADHCDFIGQQQGSLCLLPFPDDYYTVPDSSTSTGRRIDLHTGGMPKNATSVPISATSYNLNDGFSPGVGMVVRVPGLDTPAALQQAGAVPINHLGRFSEPDQPVAVID